MIRRRPFLALPGVALLAPGCAPVAWRVAGGGAEEGGIGGTGVFGTVTGQGSVLVNGLRLETWPGTAIEGLALRGGALRQGETVAAEAVRDGGRLLATRVAVFHPVIGPLERRPDGLAVLGTRLIAGPDLVLRDADGASRDPAGLRGGEMVAVSGIWRGEAVLASGLLLVGGPPRAVLRGQARREGLGLAIGGTRLDASGAAADPLAERFLTVQGRPVPGGVAVESLAEQPLAVFSGAVTRLSVEGVVAPNRGAPGLHLSGFGLPLDPASSVASRVGQRQLLLGRFGQAFRVEAGVPLPDTEAERREALGAPGTAAAISRWLGAA